MDLNKLKVPDLKKELKLRGLSTSGNKTELLERLQASLADANSTLDPTDDLDEDLLNEEDDEPIIDETESVLNDLDSPIDTPVVTTKSPTKRKSAGEAIEAPAKKIVLNRNASVTKEEETTNGNSQKADEANEVSTGEKKVIKLSELSAKERLEMRAKKFNVPLSVDAKKQARAERFGSTAATKTVSTADGNSIKASAPAANADVLKQRAERFGVKVSTQLNTLENEERMKKRLERFGAAAVNDKAQQRLKGIKVVK